MATPQEHDEALAGQKCEPCSGGVPPMEHDEIERHMESIGEKWSTVDDHHLEADYEFDDFRQALDFTNRVGEIAEREGHHPDIHLSWGKVGIELSTHEADGLTKNDFIMAAKISELMDDGRT